ncbi:MAG: hypothetical protein KGL67_00465 [Patescibacteria group bacterium]|nr:hypothetical protein [Patescibacteria group bacterium]
MNSIHYRGPFVFFSIIVVVMLGGIAYLYFHNYTPTNNVFWLDASLEVTTDWGSCPSTFPCYETYLLNQDGNVFHNNEQRGSLPTTQTKEVIQKAYNFYKDNKCTPIFETKVTQNYKLKIDGNTYEFGGTQGCEEMQSIMNTFVESINK